MFTGSDKNNRFRLLALLPSLENNKSFKFGWQRWSSLKKNKRFRIRIKMFRKLLKDFVDLDPAQLCTVLLCLTLRRNMLIRVNHLISDSTKIDSDWDLFIFAILALTDQLTTSAYQRRQEKFRIGYLRYLIGSLSKFV